MLGRDRGVGRLAGAPLAGDEESVRAARSHDGSAGRSTTGAACGTTCDPPLGRRADAGRAGLIRAQTEHRGSVDTAEGYAGYEELAPLDLLDPLGHKIGRVEKLFFNRRGGLEYVRVRIGLLFTEDVLIPVQEAALDRAARSLTLK